MKKSRSASKKRTAKKKPAKSPSAAAKRKSPKKKKTVKSRSAPEKRRTDAKAKTRAGAKKTRPRKVTKKTTRKKPAPETARKRTVSTAKKRPVRAASPRKPLAPKPVVPVVPANELKAGVVTHYYSHLTVAVVAVTERRLQVGNRIHIKGHTSDFYQTVGSMQVEHDTVSAAEIGNTVGLKVTEHAREHDTVYLVT